MLYTILYYVTVISSTADLVCTQMTFFAFQTLFCMFIINNLFNLLQYFEASECRCTVSTDDAKKIMKYPPSKLHTGCQHSWKLCVFDLAGFSLLDAKPPSYIKFQIFQICSSNHNNFLCHSTSNCFIKSSNANRPRQLSSAQLEHFKENESLCWWLW